MTADHFDRLRSIVLRASELSPNDRAAFLDRELADDPALRERAAALVARIDDEIPLLQTGALRDVAMPAGAADLAATPDEIGPYRILETMGEGGMGIVYLAEQSSPVRRRVAIKVIKPGMDTRDVIKRFDAERQALALMNHPGIARVFDAGMTAAGRPYFVMEYVDGIPITAYCEDERLSIRERLTLFIAVCHAVQHAHQRGVIHRDIKPTNILVSAQDEGPAGRAAATRIPAPRIIDFGIAKATTESAGDASILTRHGMVLGTPAYMSPEQAFPTDAGVHTATDIYALGVVLYELLAGTRPLDGVGHETTSFDELRRRIRDEEPPRPSERAPEPLRRQLRGDLDWIVMKALEKDPARRYASASEFAADIERHLRNLPVAAGPPATSYRIRKFVARNRTAVVATSVVAIALIVGTAVAIVGLVRAERAETLARADAQAAKQTTKLLVDLFDVSNPDQPSGEEVTAREILDRGAERVSKELSDQPRARAQLLNAIGDIYRKLGLYDQAIPLLEDALATRRALPGGDDPDLPPSLSSLATLYWTLGRYDEAEPLYLEALQRSEALKGPDHPDVAKHLNNLGYHYESVGEYTRAEPLLLRSQAIREKQLAPDDPRIAVGLHNLGLLYGSMGKNDLAGTYYERALASLEKSRPPDHPDYAPTLHNLASMKLKKGELAAAESLDIHAEAIWEKALGPNHPMVAKALIQRGRAYREMGRFAESESLLVRALKIAEGALGPDHVDVGEALEGIGRTWLAQGRTAEAESAFARALAIHEAAVGPDHPDAVSCRQLLADVRGGGATTKPASAHGVPVSSSPTH